MSGNPSENLVILLKRIVRGAGDLPDLGHHPGTLYMVGLIVGAWLMAGIWALLSAIVFAVPFWLQGCWERARFQEELDRLRSESFLKKVIENSIYGTFGAPLTEPPRLACGHKIAAQCDVNCAQSRKS